LRPPCRVVSFYTLCVPFTFDREAERRRIIRKGNRITARGLASAPGSPRREALEAADRAEELGLVAEAAYQRQVAEELIPEHLRWAFIPNPVDDGIIPAGWREISTEEWLQDRP
jgi:hypothetical protein